MKQIILALVVLMMVATPVDACIGARQAAMGWCGVAISDDATASYWNPAALVWAKDGMFYGSIWGGADFAIKINNTGFHCVKDWDKQYFSISYGHPINNRTAIGCNLGWCSYVDGYQYPSLDFSFLYKFNNFTFGVLAQNVKNIRPEIAYSTDFITIAAGFYDLFDICKHFNYSGISLQDFHAGLELRPISILALRAGYNTDFGYTWGVGINFKSIEFNLVSIYDEICYSINIFAFLNSIKSQ